MKCEICHKNDAKKAIRLTEGGKEKELYVCRECADKQAKLQSGRNGGHRRFGQAPDIDEPDDSFDFFNDLPFPLPGGPSDSDMPDDGNAHTLAANIPPCPNCGTTAEDISGSGLVGCPQCYVHFKESLKQTVGLHGSFGGKVPNRRGGAGGGKEAGAPGAPDAPGQ